MAKGKVLSWMTIILSTVTLASAEEEGVAVGLTGDFFSKYIWRGQNLVNDWVFQPGASVSYKGLTASIWNNMMAEDHRVGEVFVKAGNLTETDLSLDYSNRVPGLDFLGFSVGAIYYDYLNIHTHPTAEAYGGFNLDVPASPSIRWYYDFVEADGSYVQLSVGHAIEKLKEWSQGCYCGLQVGASIGMGTAHYDQFYFGVDQTALNDLTLTAGLPISLGKLKVRPTLGYSMMLNKDIRDATAPHADNFWGGIGLAYDF